MLCLAALLTGSTEKLVEAQYRRSCDGYARKGPWLFRDELLEDDELPSAWVEDEPVEGGEPQNEVMKLLESVASETVFTDPEMPETEPDPSAPVKQDWHGVSNQEEFQTLLQEGAPDASHPPQQQPKDPGEFMPWTLKECLDLTGCPFNAIFRFCVRLRSSRGGIDTSWIPNARRVRRASSKLNWHQLLGPNWDGRDEIQFLDVVAVRIFL